MNKHLRGCDDIPISGAPITESYNGQTTEESATHLHVIYNYGQSYDNTQMCGACLRGLSIIGVRYWPPRNGYIITPSQALIHAAPMFMLLLLPPVTALATAFPTLCAASKFFSRVFVMLSWMVLFPVIRIV